MEGFTIEEGEGTGSPSSQASTSAQQIPQQIPGLNLISMADFVAEYDAQEPLQKKTRTGPTDLTPLPSKPTAENAGRLNILCQQHSMRADYAFFEPHPYSFTATLKIFKGTEELYSVSSAAHTSKKHAKEDVAQAAMAFLDAQEITTTNPITTSPVVVSVKQSIDKSQNYIGRLQDHCQAKSQPLPTYTHYATSQYSINPQYGCTLSLSSRPSKVFGSAEPVHNNKKDAKQMAARSAVLYLRKEGIMLSGPEPVAGSTTSEGAQSSDTSLDNDPYSSSASEAPADAPVARVLQLCNILKLQAPQYKWTKDERVAGLVSGGAIFEDQIRLPGIIGEVQHILGQKRARGESARKVVEVLERLM